MATSESGMAFQATTGPDQFYKIGGTLDWDAPSYLKRSADQALLARLQQGELCYVLDTRQVGKSSLLVRAALHLQEVGIGIAQLDISKQGRNVSPESWYLGLLYQFAEQLSLLTEAEEYWESHEALGPVQRWFETVRHVLLQERESPLVVFIDEIDSVRGLPFSADEFFAGIRAVMQNRHQHPQWRWITFCFAGAATPAQLTQDVRATPFNIGHRIELTDFSVTDALPLADGFSYSPPEVRASLIQRIIYWTGGHPYLTQRLCYEVAKAKLTEASAVDQICRDTFLDRKARETDPNLHFVRERLLRSDEVDRHALLQLYQAIRSGKPVRYDPTHELANVLRLSGLVHVQEGNLLVRNRIYAEQFSAAWIKESAAELPDTAARRAYWRGFRRAVVLALLFLLMMTAAIWSLLSERQVRHQFAQERGQKLRLVKEIHQKESELGQLSQVQKRQQEEIHTNTENLSRLQSERVRSQQELTAIGSQLTTTRSQLVTSNRSLHESRAATQQSLKDRDAARKQAEGANRLMTQSRKNALRSAQLAEEANRNLLSTLSHHQGSEHEALRLGVSIIEPLLFSGHPPRQDVLQNIADVVNGGTFRLRQLRHNWRTTCATLSPSGKTLYVGGRGKELIVWDVATGNRLQTIQANPEGSMSHSFYTVAFSPSGPRELLTAAKDGKLRLWKVRDDETLHPQPRVFTVEGPPQNNRASTMLQACFSPDGTEIASAAHDPEKRYGVAILDRFTGKRRAFVGSLPDSLWAVSWSPGGTLIALASNSGEVEIWDAKTVRRVISLNGKSPTLRVTSLKFLTDDILLSGDNMGCVTEWAVAPGNPESWERRHEYRGSRTASIWGLDANLYRLMVTGDSTGKITLWQLGSPEQPLKTIETQVGALFEIRFLPSHRPVRDFTFTTAGQGDLVEVWHVGQHFYGTQQGAALTASFTTAGLQFVMADADGLIRRRSVAPQSYRTGIEGTIQAEPGHPLRAVTAVALSPDDKLLASGTTNGNIRIWGAEHEGNIYGDRTARALTSGGGTVHALAFSPNKKLLVSVGRSKVGSGPDGQEAIQLWEVSTGRPLRRWRIPATGSGAAPPKSQGWGYQIYSATFTHSGQEVLCASEDGGVYILQPERSGFSQVLRPQDLPAHVSATDAVPSPKGTHVAVSYSDGSLRLWDRASGSVVRLLTTREVAVLSVAISPDGKWLASAQKDGLVKLWSLAVLLDNQKISPEPDLILFGHTRPVLSVRFSPESQRVITASEDGTVRIFPVTAQEYLAEAKGILRFRPSKPSLSREGLIRGDQ